MKNRECLLHLFLVASLVPALIMPRIASTQHHSNVVLFNEEVELRFADEAVSIANYTDDTQEPTGWQLFPSIYFDSNNNGMFEDNESIGHTLSPSIHFTHNRQTHHFWPMHQSIMGLGDLQVISSGWVNPKTYRSTVTDADRLLTMECTVNLLDGNNYFTQEIKVTSTGSHLKYVNLVVYVGADINGPFEDHAYIDLAHNNMLKVNDTKTGVWFGAHPSICADSFEVSEWNDGPSEGEDLWQHVLNNCLDGTTKSSGDIEGALKFNLYDIPPGQSKSLTIHYSVGMSENDLYAPTVPSQNIAITGTSISKTVTNDTITYLAINVTNTEVQESTFRVFAYWNETLIESKLVENLTSGKYRIVTFRWDTTAIPLGNYSISFSIPPSCRYFSGVVSEVIRGEIALDRKVNILDIAIVARAFGSTTLKQDINRDGIVDGIDANIVAWAFNSYSGDPNWNPDADLDANGIIDIFDVNAVSGAFNKHANLGWNLLADLNNDSIINILDIAAVARNFGKTY